MRHSQVFGHSGLFVCFNGSFQKSKATVCSTQQWKQQDRAEKSSSYKNTIQIGGAARSARSCELLLLLGGERICLFGWDLLLCNNQTSIGCVSL